MDLGTGLLGLVAGSGSIWSEGWGVCSGCLRLGPRARGGWVEAEWCFFIYLPHLVLSAILDVTYSVMSCTAPK